MRSDKERFILKIQVTNGIFVDNCLSLPIYKFKGVQYAYDSMKQLQLISDSFKCPNDLYKSQNKFLFVQNVCDDVSF